MLLSHFAQVDNAFAKMSPRMCPLSCRFKSFYIQSFVCLYVRVYITKRCANADRDVLTINCAHMQACMVYCCMLKVTVLKEFSPFS